MVAGLQSEHHTLMLTGMQRLLLAMYQLAWHLGLPLALLYLWLRGRKEPLYRHFLGERFGKLDCSLKAPFWLHSASLGELRGAMPLIDKLLAEGLPVLITTLTPAGRTAANQRYAQAILEGKLQVSYLPLELSWAVRAFAGRVKPSCMVSSEIDTWPTLLYTLKSMGIPLGIVNAQYPQKSFIKDQAWAGFRAAFFRAYEIVLCKSKLHAERFIATGCPKVEVVGELRFDLPIPQAQVRAAQRMRKSQPAICGVRHVICIASLIEDEEDLLLDACQEFVNDMARHGHTRPLFIFVPRSPQRFDTVAERLQALGWRLLRRSQDLNSNFEIVHAINQPVDVLLGDSLGEMYFYLALADTVTVCGSFIKNGSHNVIEPLALQKPVIVGPSIWGIEYPGQEALAAGVLTQVPSAQALPALWMAFVAEANAQAQFQTRAQEFMREHSDSVGKHWQHLSAWLRSHA
jgi:3-deoxy-D-manno-octulosonic-acid transferase